MCVARSPIHNRCSEDWIVRRLAVARHHVQLGMTVIVYYRDREQMRDYGGFGERPRLACQQGNRYIRLQNLAFPVVIVQ